MGWGLPSPKKLPENPKKPDQTPTNQWTKTPPELLLDWEFCCWLPHQKLTRHKELVCFYYRKKTELSHLLSHLFLWKIPLGISFPPFFPWPPQLWSWDEAAGLAWGIIQEKAMKFSLFPSRGVFALPSRQSPLLRIPLLPGPVAPWLPDKIWIFKALLPRLMPSHLHFVAPRAGQANSFKVQFMLCRIARLGGKKTAQEMEKSLGS